MSVHTEQLASLIFVGVPTVTSNDQEKSEETAKIPGAWQDFFLNDRGAQIVNSVDSSKIYGMYTDYETDHNGHYTMAIGTFVNSADIVPEGMVVKKLPASKYQVFESSNGIVNEVVPNLWRKVWATFEKPKSLARTYTGDFEVYEYDEFDPFNCQMQICIAVK